VFPRHRLDIGATDLWFALRATFGRTDPAQAAAELLRTAGLERCGLVCLSVRSAWDLLLGVLDWPPGSEVLVSAITHPGMVAILRAHGLQAVPVDLDLDTLAPSVAALEAARTDRTRGVLVAHLFGGRLDLDPLLGFARRHDLLLVEDGAQAFTGLASLVPSGADASLFSFGLIKTASAAGGALMMVADPTLLARLRTAHAHWPRQRARSYAAKLAKTAGLALFNEPWRFAVLQRACRAARIDLDGMINAATRSFAAGPAMLAKIRAGRRPGWWPCCTAGSAASTPTGSPPGRRWARSWPPGFRARTATRASGCTGVRTGCSRSPRPTPTGSSPSCAAAAWTPARGPATSLRSPPRMAGCHPGRPS